MQPAGILVFVFGLVALTQAASLPKDVTYGNCYDIKTSTTLDYAQFAKGKWFEISRYYNEFEGTADCSEQSFIAEAGGEFIIGFNVRFSNGSQGLLQGNVNYTLGNNETLLDAVFPGSSQIAAYDILATDYVNYAITYACIQQSSGVLPVKNEHLWVLGRDTQFSKEIQEIVEQDLIYQGDSLGALLYDVNQDKC